MERLILLEHTVPYDSLDFVRAASAGGMPGGVCGLGSLLGTYPPAMVNKKSQSFDSSKLQYSGKIWFVVMVGRQKVPVAATGLFPGFFPDAHSHAPHHCLLLPCRGVS
jgi:hypothetical protein